MGVSLCLRVMESVSSLDSILYYLSGPRIASFSYCDVYVELLWKTKHRINMSLHVGGWYYLEKNNLVQRMLFSTHYQRSGCRTESCFEQNHPETPLHPLCLSFGGKIIQRLTLKILMQIITVKIAIK